MEMCGKIFNLIDHVDCKIITFEVKRKEFLDLASRGQQSLTHLCRKVGTMQL
jgi:hypothetical protein